VAFAFLAVMALGTVPSPLYGLYRARDHFSLFMVTVAFAVYAIGVIGALLLGGHLSDLYGRRRLLLPSVGIAIASAVVFLASKSLAGLLVGRLISGLSIGIVASTATAYLAELHAVGRPQATAAKAQLTAPAVNVGGLGVGALVAGVLAQWVAHPLTVPYLVFLAALVLAAIGVALAPETREASKGGNRAGRFRRSVCRKRIPKGRTGANSMVLPLGVRDCHEPICTLPAFASTALAGINVFGRCRRLAPV
jgi:MFS family permease